MSALHKIHEITERVRRKLFGSDELEADRRGHRDVVASRSQLPRVAVDVERHDRVAELIFHEEKIPRRIEREVARLFATGRNGACLRQSSFFRIDAKNRDVVQSAIRNVKKSTAGMDGDFGDVVAAGEFRRQSRNAADLFQSALFRVVGKTRCGRIKFTDNKQKFCIWRKNGVARAGPGFQCGAGRDVRAKSAFRCVKLENQNLIQAQIGGERKPVVGAGFDPMRVRAFLPLFYRSKRAAVLIEGSLIADLSVGQNWKYSKRSRRIVCNEDVFAALIECDVARIFAQRRHLIQLGQLAAFCIERKRRDKAGLAAFVHGVEKFSAGMNRHEGWVGRFRRNAQRRQFTARGVVTKSINSLALRFRGVSSSKRKEVFGLRFLLLFVFCNTREDRNEQRNRERDRATEDFHGAAQCSTEGLLLFRPDCGFYLVLYQGDQFVALWPEYPGFSFFGLRRLKLESAEELPFVRKHYVLCVAIAVLKANIKGVSFASSSRIGDGNVQSHADCFVMVL